MALLSKLRQRWTDFLHDDELKQKVYTIVFESDTPRGKLFDLILIASIILSVMLVILESMHVFPHSAYLVLRALEYLLTLFFTIEYLARIYCLRQPRKYIFSFFGIVDLLATLPVYLSFIFHGSHYLLVIRAFRLIRVFRIFKLFQFINEGNLLLRSLWISAPKILIFFLFVLILVISMGTIMYMIEGNSPGSGFNNIPNSIYWLHHHRRAHRHRIGHDGPTAQGVGSQALSPLPSRRARRGGSLLQILRRKAETGEKRQASQR